MNTQTPTPVKPLPFRSVASEAIRTLWGSIRVTRAPRPLECGRHRYPIQMRVANEGEVVTVQLSQAGAEALVAQLQAALCGEREVA